MRNQESGFNITMHDGRNLNISTTEGADAFIRTCSMKGSFQQFSSSIIDHIGNMRQKPRPTTQEKYQMYVGYVTFIKIAENASLEVFDTIPKSEFECWFDHVNDVLPKIKKNECWNQKGELEDHDDAFLSVNLYFAMHYKPVQVALEKDVYKTIASFIASREAPKMPSLTVAITVTHIVNNSFLSYRMESMVNIGGNEKLWKKLEASGLLLQFIRCSTYPEIQDVALYICYEDLLKYLPLIKKKFKRGELSGDALHSIISGEDGSKQKNPRVLRFLRNISKIADDAQTLDICKEVGTLRMCRHCNKMDFSAKFQKRLMQCSRCKQAFYCSKECQTKDWDSHKPYCKAFDNKYIEKSSLVIQDCLLSFNQRNYIAIQEQIVEVIGITGLSKEELLMEVDFKPNSQGHVPALASPPEFQIKDAYGYFEGERPNEPNWFQKDTNPEFYKKNIQKSIGALKDQFDRMTTKHVLCLCRTTNGNVSALRMNIQSLKKRTHLNSIEALTLIKKFIENEDFSGLNQEQISTIKSTNSIPSASEIDQAIMKLNAMLGSDSFPLRGASLSSQENTPRPKLSLQDEHSVSTSLYYPVPSCYRITKKISDPCNCCHSKHSLRYHLHLNRCRDPRVYSMMDSLNHKELIPSDNRERTMNDIDPYRFLDNSISDILNNKSNVQSNREGNLSKPLLICEKPEHGLDWNAIHTLIHNDESNYKKMEFMHNGKKIECLSMDTLVMMANDCERSLLNPITKIDNLSVSMKGLLKLSQFESAAESAHIAISTLISLNMLESAIRVLTKREHGRAPLLKDMIEIIGNNREVSGCNLDNRISSLLAPILRSLLLPNVGINLRNVLWHGFSATIHRRWLALCITLTISIQQLSEDDDIQNIDQIVGDNDFDEQSLSNLRRMREHPLLTQVLDCGQNILSSTSDLELLRNEMMTSQFIPSTHLQLVYLVMDSNFLKSFPVISSAVMSILIEHGLRLWWCDVNDVDEKIAKPGSYYVTLDGNSQRDKHDIIIHPYLTNDGKNKLVYELGGSTMALLADLFASPSGGPNIRASITHGLYDRYLLKELKASSLLSHPPNALSDMANALVFTLRLLTSKRQQKMYKLKDVKIQQVYKFRPTFSYSASMVQAIKNAVDSIQSFRSILISDDRITSAANNVIDKKQDEITNILVAFDDKCTMMNFSSQNAILHVFDVDARDSCNWNHENTFYEVKTNEIAANCGASILLLNEVATGLNSRRNELKNALLDCDEGGSISSRRRKQISRIFSLGTLTISFYNVCILCALLFIQKKTLVISEQKNYISVTEEILIKAVKRSRMVASTFHTSTNSDRAIKSIKEYLVGKSIKEIFKILDES